ncbi:tRNA preQ1(34) S-adenosylmethionine ribosyltransferase-isomerase QueA [Tumebacillus permanentifrigoris]|uniref:S-adenosylmethionine:tRNA ribosyltransferase-isomerase n=1 Tax=Tumebacillus permanentifrigoris TaxID=378543 RepID=A0A316D5F2_9BACL|nr:tRNA preQ1(34) S-adenosylmethionine ribosyltransferase-isomerase QueA [Tumebacillus permanentifrigoris]PWK08973.1 S-adenosylmethionine--tRNA ribosyltransferase-isomerase [Tumebacillus permanentifrigoris]
MRLDQFDFELPEELIAQHPLAERTASRLMTLNKRTGETGNHKFADLIEYLQAGDTLILNDTRVIPARLYGVKPDTGAKVEFLLLKETGIDTWEVLVRPGKKVRPGTTVSFGDGLLTAEVLDSTEEGGRIVRFSYDGIFYEVLDRLGEMPLPPYITAQLDDNERYQTVFNKHRGSVAAPTAGLHFTTEFLDRLAFKGIRIGFVTLHVGLGTFRPVAAEDILDHKMHAEYYDMPAETADLISATKAAGGRVICVGTTACRTVESVGMKGEVTASSGWTDIFIHPGYEFKLVDALLTNFHLPKSSLMMLISALAGHENVMRAYEEAVRERYRFFSFGDAMFIY